MTSVKKKTHAREILGTLISVALAIVFCFIAFRGIDVSVFWSTLKSISLFYLLLFCISTIFSHYLRAVRWKVLLQKVKPGLSSHHAFGALMVGYGVNNVIPRFGEVTRALLLGRYEGVSRMSILGSIMVERIIDMLCFGFAILIAGIIFSGNIYQQFPWLKTAFIIGLAICVAFIAVFVFLFRHRQTGGQTLRKMFFFLPAKLSQFLDQVLQKLFNGFSGLSDIRVLSKTAMLSIAIMCNYALTSYIGFYVVNMQSLYPVDYNMAWVVMSISAIGVMIPTPGGIGSYHTISRTTLTALYGISDNLSIVYAVLNHGIAYVLFIVFALAYFFLFRKRFGHLEPASDLFSEADGKN
ncbi:MAG: flippase-like domain-containing protein [Ignavibacteria bacterium]|nr:flippase-like domain-containing protein [Ignavibacteria bacterium]